MKKSKKCTIQVWSCKAFLVSCRMPSNLSVPHLRMSSPQTRFLMLKAKARKDLRNNTLHLLLGYNGWRPTFVIISRYLYIVDIPTLNEIWFSKKAKEINVYAKLYYFWPKFIPTLLIRIKFVRYFNSHIFVHMFTMCITWR